MKRKEMPILQKVRRHRKPKQSHLSFRIRWHAAERRDSVALRIPMLHTTGKFHKHDVAITQHLELDCVATTRY